MLRAGFRRVVPIVLAVLVVIVLTPSRRVCGEDETVKTRVDRLVREVNDPGRTHERRAEAIRRLAYLGPWSGPAVPSLVRELKNEMPLVKELAVFALGMIGPKAADAVPALQDLIFSDCDELLKWAAGQAIRLIKAAVPEGVPAPDLRAEPADGAPLDEDPLMNAMIYVTGIDAGKWQQGAMELERLGPRAAAALPALYRLAEAAGSEPVRTAARSAIRAIQAPAEAPAVHPPVNPLAPEEPAEPADAEPPEEVPAEVQGYIDDLAGADVTKRWQAAMMLGQLGREARAAVPALITALDDHDAIVRMWVAGSLGKMAPESAPALPRLQALRASDPDAQVRRNAALAVERILAAVPAGPAVPSGPTAPMTAEVRALVEKLADADAFVRMKAAKQLGAMGPAAAAAAPAIEKLAATDPDPDVRAVASAALQQIRPAGAGGGAGDPPVAGLLVELASDDVFIRMSAAKKLGALGAAAKAALPALRKVAAEDPDADVRRLAANAVAAIGGEEALPPDPGGSKFVGNWKGDFTTELGSFCEVLSFLPGGRVQAVILSTRGYKIWAGEGEYSYRNGVLLAHFQGEEAQNLPVKWFPDGSFEIQSRGISVRFHRMD